MAHQTFFALSCFILMTMTSSAPPNHDYKTYADTEKPEFLTQLVAVHQTTGDVYMASYNKLYHLDADLVLKQRVRTGPKEICDAVYLTCTTTDTNPHVLLLVYQLESLLLCGDPSKSACQLRPLNDLDQVHWVGNKTDLISYSIRNLGDPAFFGPGYGSQTVFYSGNDWKPGKDTGLPFFSSKVLVQEDGQFRFKYSFQSDSSQSAVFFKLPSEQTLIYSFTHGPYVYLLFFRSRTGTILARICIEDGTFTSYVEQPLACDKEPNLYISATSAVLGPMIEDGIPVDHLYVAFRRQLSVICTYSIQNLNRIFDTAIQDCFGTANHTYRLDTETGDFLKCQAKSNEEHLDTCERSSNPFIASTRKTIAPTTATVTNNGLLVTSMNVFEENGRIFGVFVFNHNYLMKVLLYGPHQRFLLHVFTPEGRDIIQKSTALDLKKEHIYVLTRSKVVKYPIRSCSIYRTCIACMKAFADPLECGWCNGKCVRRQECTSEEQFSKTQCPPSIHSVTPLIGPTKGGTHLTIIGEYFGLTTSSTINHVSIDRVPCDIVLWEMERVMCSTGSSPNAVKAPVKLTVRAISNQTFGFVGTAESKELFSYVETRIDNIAPDRGSISGGTFLTIFGSNLHIGSKYELNIRGRTCGHLKVLQFVISCITAASVDPDLKDEIELRIDGVSFRHPNPSFRYLPDPEIYKMHPLATVLSFRGNVTVIGRFFDSLDHISMFVKINSTEGKELQLKQKLPCWQVPGSSGTELSCPIPVVDSRKFPFPEDGPLVAKLDFDIWPLNGNFSGLLQLYFYPEPEFQEVQTVLDNQTVLEIKFQGKYPGASSLAHLMKVEIGENGPCNISELTSDTLHCRLHRDLLANASLWGKNLSVKVTTGSTLHHVGFLVINGREVEEPLVQKASWPVVLASVLVLCGLLLAATAVCYFFRRRRLSTANLKKNYGPDANHTRDLATKEPILLTKRPATSVLNGTDQKEVTSDVRQADGAEPPVDVPLAFQELQQDDTQEIASLDVNLRTLATEGWIIPEALLKLEEVVGAGLHGSVHKGEYISPKHGNIQVAVKSIHQNPDLNEMTVTEFLNESLRMKDFDHEHVLRLVGICFPEDIPMIVLPFMENGDLCSFLRNEDNNLLKLDLLGFSAQIASGMDYLAKHNYVHRDLATRNCLLSSDRKVKVADFGLSRDVYESDYYRIDTESRKLPYRWMAPECIELGIFSVKSDVWSFGVVLWEIMTRGVLPYEEIDNWSIIEFLKSGERLKQPQHCSDNLYRVMLNCWEYAPSNRLSFEELHSVVTQLWASASCKDRVQTVSAENNIYCNLE